MFTFLGKSLYPIVFISIFYIVYPNINSKDIIETLKALGIEKIKIGDTEITLFKDTIKEKATHIAKLNQDVLKLQKVNAVYESRIEEIENNFLKYINTEKNTSAEKIKRDTLSEKIYKINNSKFTKFTTLVFHDTKSSHLSNEITEFLLQEGFKSSNTLTNFSELKSIKPEVNNIHITYNSKGKAIIKEFEKILNKLIADKPITVTIHKNSFHLKNGDIQVLIF